jgi:hypothetical protein
MVNCRAINSGIGFLSYAGNSMLNDCSAENDFYGFAGGGFGGNIMHSELIGCTANHNTYPIMFRAGADLITGFVMLANTFPAMVADGANIDFRDCWLNNTTPAILVTNDAASLTLVTTISIQSCFTHASGIGSFVSVVSSNCSASLFGNIDSTTFAGDQTALYGLATVTNSTSTGNGVITYSGWAGNGAGLTNIPNSALPANVVTTNLTVVGSITLQLPNGTKIVFTNGAFASHLGIASTGGGLTTIDANELDIANTVGTSSRNGFVTVQGAGGVNFVGFGLVTNTAPSNVTLGVTAPDWWSPITNASTGTVGWTPMWKNH